MQTNNYQTYIKKITEISKLLNYEFSDQDLIHNALTRKSSIIEKTQEAFIFPNTKLEFIGDSLLNFIIGELVYINNSNFDESELTNLRAEIISTEHLGEFLIKKEMGQFLMIGKGEEINAIRKNKKALVEMIKAVFGAIYIDTGFNTKYTKAIIINFIYPLIVEKFESFMGKSQIKINQNECNNNDLGNLGIYNI